MKLFLIIAVIFTFEYCTESSASSGNTVRYDDKYSWKNLESENGNKHIQKRDVFYSDVDSLSSRKEDFCSFTKLEKKIDELPDPEECNKINKRFKENENFDFINYFGETFNLLKVGIDSIKFPTADKMDVIFFVGNTGSGKSTLVQILGADNTKIFSKKPYEFSSDFIIVDDLKKIGADTVTSQTLYPDMLVDSETGYVLVDNPGFQDTRSPVHEIIATYGMRKVLEHTRKLKIVIVSTHSSLKVGMYRDDFPNLLKHLADFFYDMDKFKDSIYIIGTKVENTYVMIKNQPIVVSASSIITGTAHFLKEVKKSLNDNSHSFNITSVNKEVFIKKSIKILDSLLENNNGKFTKINIMKRPAEEGPLSEIDAIQKERNSIRQMLLNDQNMIDIKPGDFGFPLTESALLYLNEIFTKMDSYITKLSSIISEYMMTYYTNLIQSKTELDDAISFVRSMKVKLRHLSDDIGSAINPGKYAEIVTKFSESNYLKLDCLTTFKNISTLNDYLVNLEDLSDGTKYTPLSWNMSMRKISEFIESKEDQYQLLKDIFQITSTHKSQRYKQSFGLNLIINKNNFGEFLSKNHLNTRYELVSIDDKLLENINTILTVTLKHKEKIICENETLTFIDYFILLSKLNYEYFQSCPNANTIAILAMHTLFVDYDLTDNFLKGKQLVIIAPVWEVIGSRTISVEGLSGGEKFAKADFSKVGLNGENGKSGGSFFGIGMKYRNENNLRISASGGDGQDGQDGGDGRDGESGTHAKGNRGVKQGGGTKGIYPIFGSEIEVSLVSGSFGSSGGDAGAGGYGGYGGKKGWAVMHNIGDEPHQITILANDGKQGNKGKDGVPGKGGMKGCDKRIINTKSKFAFITIGSDTSVEYVNCNEKLPSGFLKQPNSKPTINDNSETNNDSPVCVHIMNFQNHYIKEYHSLLSDGITRKFVNDMKLTKY